MELFPVFRYNIQVIILIKREWFWVKVLIVMLILAVFWMISSRGAEAADDKILYDFEQTVENWKIPDWAYYQDDHRAVELAPSEKKFSNGKSSLEVMCDFPGTKWAAALVELEKD